MKLSLKNSVAWLAILSLLAAYIIGQAKKGTQIITQLHNSLPQSVEFYKISNKPLLFESRRKGTEEFYRYISVEKAQGWGGPLLLAAVIDSKGIIERIIVLDHKETPPFFYKIQKHKFFRQFTGKKVSAPLLLGQDIDAVTQATISSKAITEAVRKGTHALGRKILKFPIKEHQKIWKFGIKEVILVTACAYAFFTIFSSLIAVAWLKKKPISKMWDLALIEFRNETKLIGLGFLIAILFVFIFKLTLSEFLLNILIFERLPLIPFVLFFFLPTFITHEFLWRRTVQEYFGGSAKRAILGSITLSLFSKIFVPILAALFIVAYGGPYMFALIAAGLIVAVAIICELIAAVSYYATREISLASSISSLYWAWFGIMFSIRVLLIISI